MPRVTLFPAQLIEEIDKTAELAGGGDVIVEEVNDDVDDDDDTPGGPLYSWNLIILFGILLADVEVNGDDAADVADVCEV